METRAPHNTLTDQEKADGWKLLFDGQSTAGWHRYNKDHIDAGWVAEDGCLTLKRPGQDEGGDIVTDEQFGDFELTMDWKISPKGNSGIFYRGVEGARDWVWMTALEMQVLDDERHPDARNGRDRLAGGLYALFDVPDPSPVRPAGEWNTVGVILKDGQLRHVVNGRTILDIAFWGLEFTAAVRGSKFAQWPEFAKADRGVLGVQDHGDPVWYRNIKVRAFD